MPDEAIESMLDVLLAWPGLDLVTRSKKTGQSYAAWVVKIGSWRGGVDIEGRIRAALVAQGHDPDEVLSDPSSVADGVGS